MRPPTRTKKRLSRPRAASPEGTAKGVAAIERALAILSAFQSDRSIIGLAELTALTGLSKATIRRLAQSLTHGHLLVRLHNGDYRIGAEALRLGTLYQESFNVADVLGPAMQWLAKISHESIVFYVREGMNRVCLLRVESNQPIRYHVREGDAMSFEGGSCGEVILAFEGMPGEPYEGIRRAYFYDTVGKGRDTAGIAAPVFGPDRRLIGALGISGPATRVDAAFARQVTPGLLEAVSKATHDLGGDSSVFDGPLSAISSKVRVAARNG